jgi:S1-C subfamily serine protease
MRLNGLVVLLLTMQACSFARADIAQTIAQVKPSVLIVGTFKATGNPRFSLRGTGFVVPDGKLDVSNLFVTNAHVLVQVADAAADTALVVQVKGAKGEWQMRAVTVLDVDQVHDLALLRFEGAALPSLNVGDSATVREGQPVAFMGFPIGGALGFSPVTHRGFISSIAAVALPTPTAQQLNSKVIRSVRSGISFDIFQLDGTAYPGNSGGPLFDPATGKVLGVLNMVFIKGTRESALTHPSGISYAIPSEHIKQLLLRQGAQ